VPARQCPLDDRGPEELRPAEDEELHRANLSGGRESGSRTFLTPPPAPVRFDAGNAKRAGESGGGRYQPVTAAASSSGEGASLTAARAAVSALATATARDEPVTLALLDAFELRCDGEPVSLPPSAQRLLALLALRERPLLRLHVAGTLWLDTTEERASANLRSSLWRLNRPGPRLVEATSLQLRLAPEVRVDVRETAALAHRLLAASDGADGAEADLDPARLTGELLPDWYDDWVLIERERLRQLSLHALEALGERLLDTAKLGGALEAALAAIAMEPLRESAHRLLIRIHLTEGNAAEAIRQFDLCRGLFREQLGLEPSPQLAQLVANLTS
jgi:DNA-binding SARP family transcriptional activator